MNKQIEVLIDKYGLTHLKEELIHTVFPCVKVVPKQEETVAVGSSKMGGVPDLPATLEYPMYKGNPLQFIAQFNLNDLQNVGMGHSLPKTGMLYFFSIENYLEEDVNPTEAGRVLYYDVPVEQLRRADELQTNYNQCATTFELTYKLPELFIEDEADSDRFLQLLEELIPDNYDNHQMFGEPFSVQDEVLYETGQYMNIEPQQMTLLFQIDSDTKNCNMMWGDLGMLYFCIGNEDLKNRRFENTCCVLQTC
ncbi:YwqG family protein [Bacillus wiedmannii]|uniref:Cytoplasmic protein n=1 Tax=Bacillus wiedmannii TaxID=1890302 RepID=A0A2C3NE96_9BACI|nr:YwqG family protein [Bacillus wiedmannii]PEI69485.1 cytoplasmic protein [Bacillus wiedmannii]PEJ69578.1 cytoplasmic protein [Bacillus wiedmannii]PEL15938.1 cytoplasmic protein [Bacillus wiedmannii]PFZ22712.1 cytoplasmic protein [Bacillus wiedmannii]PHA05106.1 cytoplasmic protein [Bacillus wiedmannii]